MAARRLAAPAVTSLLTMIACGVLAAPALATPPTNTTPPTVTGPSATLQQGQTVTENPGAWDGGQPTSVVWYDCSDNCIPIETAPTQPGASYTLTQTDVGQNIMVVETATADDGSLETATANSTPVGPVQPPLMNNTLPSISGTAQEGQTLTEVPGSWQGAAQPVSVQWNDCNSSGTICTPIGPSGSPGSTYKVTQGDVGQYIVVTETATDFGGTMSRASSTPLGPVAVPTPGIQGTPEQGQTLTEMPAAWTPNPPNGVKVQWEDCDSSGNHCNPLGFPTTQGSTYTPTANDFGKYIVVMETADYGAGSTPSSSSTPLGPVSATSTTALSTAPSSVVTNQAVTLIATLMSGAVQPSGSITFMNGGTAIGGCANEPVPTPGGSDAVVCQTSFPASSPQLTAVFTPTVGSLVAGSASAVVPLTVGQDTSTTTLDGSSTVNVGQITTYTASVAPPNVRPGPVLPSGSVEFLDGGQPIGGCTSQPVVGGGATCTVTYPTPGTHAITARYGGDANFISSASSSQTVTVVTPPAPPPGPPTSGQPPAQQVLGTITATMQWTFNFTPQYTKVLALVLNGAHQTTVTVRCAGRGCPFRSHAIAVGAAQRCRKHKGHRCPSASGLNLTGIFHSRHLRVGTRITVAITKPSWIGKYYRFTIRSGRGPGVHIGCLAPGATRPGGRC
jgi:Bacterial Ig-like domain (group 3)